MWQLFADREDIERAMTTTVRDRVHASRGIEIRATDDDDFEESEAAVPPSEPGADADAAGSVN